MASEDTPAASDDTAADAALDAMVRQEIEAAFAGLEEAIATGDEEAALALIQTQGKEVLNNVLKQLDNDGKLLSSNLTMRVESLATSQRTEMLKKYDAQYAAAPRDSCPVTCNHIHPTLPSRMCACAGWPTCRHRWPRTAKPSATSCRLWSA